jgi:hypothetical protein
LAEEKKLLSAVAVLLPRSAVRSALSWSRTGASMACSLHCAKATLDFNNPLELPIKSNHPLLGAGGSVRLYTVNLYPPLDRAPDPAVS